MNDPSWKVKRLTIDGQFDDLFVQLEADNRRDALEPSSVVSGVRQKAVRPALAAVRYVTQPAPTGQTGVARKLEVGGDVTPTDEEFDVRRRISAERDAAQRAGSAVDEVDTDRRRRLIRDEVVVRNYNHLHRHCTHHLSTFVDPSLITDNSDRSTSTQWRFRNQIISIVITVLQYYYYYLMRTCQY